MRGRGKRVATWAGVLAFGVVGLAALLCWPPPQPRFLRSREEVLVRAEIFRALASKTPDVEVRYVAFGTAEQKYMDPSPEEFAEFLKALGDSNNRVKRASEFHGTLEDMARWRGPPSAFYVIEIKQWVAGIAVRASGDVVQGPLSGWGADIELKKVSGKWVVSQMDLTHYF